MLRWDQPPDVNGPWVGIKFLDWGPLPAGPLVMSTLQSQCQLMLRVQLEPRVSGLGAWWSRPIDNLLEYEELFVDQG
jgi:hypothetical protein